jgi:TPR repeat protein
MHGVVVTTDPIEAVKWFRGAAEQGNPKAQNNLGHCLANGTGIARDDVDAARWMRRLPAAGQDLRADLERRLGRTEKERAKQRSEEIRRMIGAGEGR